MFVDGTNPAEARPSRLTKTPLHVAARHGVCQRSCALGWQKGSAYETPMKVLVSQGRPLFFLVGSFCKAIKTMAENSTNQVQPAMDAQQVARRLGISVYTVKREVKRGAMDYYRVGSGRGRLRFSEAHLQKYLAGRENIDRIEVTGGVQ